MKYSVLIQPPAETDIEAAYHYIRADSKLSANRWLTGLMKVILSLSSFPNRCGLARESREFDEPIRQLNFGRRHNAYRIVFAIRANQIRVLRVLHGARETLLRNELDA
ncbi:MAG TPA: type II toxin-antitoxin system RelE/ParE family toxin [Tepidisphaeraceae bacterium]|nr:type II toxin-antitoxin system RelE/ParE family toxin [Tepidisphaeraceae bacterium]